MLMTISLLHQANIHLVCIGQSTYQLHLSVEILNSSLGSHGPKATESAHAPNVFGYLLRVLLRLPRRGRMALPLNT